MNQNTSKKLLLQTVSGKPVYDSVNGSYTTESHYTDVGGEQQARRRSSTYLASSSEENRAYNARRACKFVGEQCEWIDSGETEEFFQP